MAVYVGPARWPYRDRLWAHLTADTKEELLAFALRLGLRESWRQGWDGRHWHYDIPAEVRDEALALGALPRTDRELVTLARQRAAATTD